MLTPDADLLTHDEMLRLVRHFAALGVHKVRLTGGEPTLRRDLERTVEAISSTPGITAVAMTSNGLALSAERLRALHGAGLTHVNLSLDTLRRERFEGISRRPPSYWDRARAAIDAAAALPFAAVKVNAVVMRGVNDDELHEFAQLTREPRPASALADAAAAQTDSAAPPPLRGLDVRFIELMPFAGNDWTAARFMPAGDIRSTLEARAAQAGHGRLQAVDRAAVEEEGAAPPAADETAALYRLPGHAGRIGIIASASGAFCGSCSRLRLTADGNVRACLHGADEVSLRDVLRRRWGADSESAPPADAEPTPAPSHDYNSVDDALTAAIAAAVQRKHFSLGGHGGVEGLAAAVQGPALTPARAAAAASDGGARPGSVGAANAAAGGAAPSAMPADVAAGGGSGRGRGSARPMIRIGG